MKKVLFLMLAMVIGITAANAQQKVAYKKGDMFKASVTTSLPELMGKDGAAAMNFAPGEVMTRTANHYTAKASEEWETMTTIYDLQSNSMIGNRIAVWEDGTAAVTATWSSDASPYNTRGTGYNYYDGSTFGDQPEARVEDAKRGWPSITPLGNGELLTSHGDGVFMYKRDTKGDGNWNEIHHFRDNNYHGYTADAGAWTWARVATSGENDQYVHVLLADQQSIDGNNRSIVAYIRSTDGGETFTAPADPPLIDIEADYLLDISADDYMIATNGDKVALLFCSMNYDLFYLYSEDNGETWTKQVVWNFRGDDHAWDWGRTDVSSSTDSIWAPDNSASIAIDNDGTVHVAFGLIRWAPAPDSGWGYYTYWPFTDGIVYWNSNYTNEQGGHEIPNFGDWSGDANLQVSMGSNGVNGISSTLNDERIYALAEADDFQNLNLITPDENHNGQLDYTSELWDNHWGSYRTLGIATLPAISIDENGNMIIAYSVLSESRTGTLPAGTDFYLRSCIITARDSDGTWFYDAINLSDNYTHSSDEVYSVTGNSQGHNCEFWIAYSADEEMGLMLDADENAQQTATDNIIWATKVNPSDLEGFDYVGEVVNPMTAARVYPNPTNGILNIEVNASQSSNVTMSVFNIMGQKVAEKSASFNTGINTASINTNELSSGVYFVTVKANGFEKTMKFVVK